MKIIITLFFIIISLSNLQAQQSVILKEGHRQYKLAIEEGRYEEAYEHAYHCWGTLKGMQPQRDSIMGLANYYLSETLYLNQQQEEALPYFLEAKALVGRSYGKEHINYALVLNSMANVHSDLDEFELAEEYSLEAIRIYKKYLPKEEYNYLGAMCNLATLYDITGRYEEAKALYHSILDQYTMDKKRELYTAVLMNLALLQDEMGDYDAAKKAYLEVQTIFKENNKEQHPDYAALLTNMGIMYHGLEEYEQTENLFLQAIEIFSNELSGNFYDISSAYSGLAILYSDLGKYDKAEYYYLKTVQLTKEFMGSDSYDYAWSISNLGVYYEETEQFEKAKKRYLEAQEILIDVFGKKHTSYATNLSHLSSVYLETKELDKSLKLVNEGLALMEEIQGKEHVGYLILMNRIINLYFLKKDYSKALDYAYQTIEINGGFSFAKRIIDQEWCDTILNQSFVSWSHLNITLKLIFLILDQNKSDEAAQVRLSLVETAIVLFERRRNEYSTEKDKLFLLNGSTGWAEEGIHIVEKLRHHPEWNKYKRQAFGFAEKNKSVLLTGDLQAEKAYSFGDLPDSLAAQEQLLQKEYDEYKAYLLDDIMEDERQEIYSYLSDLLLEKDAFKKHIESNYPKYNQLKYTSKIISIEEIQQTLDAQTALLEYSVSDTVVTVFYVDQQQFQLYSFPIEYQVLASKIALLHQTLSNYNLLTKAPQEAHQKYTKVAYWFYKNLVTI